MKIKSYDVITKALSDIHDLNITKKDIYKKNKFLFVNIKFHNMVEVFDYPVNDLLEVGNHIPNYYDKDIKDLIDNDVDFSCEYPKLKKDLEPKITFERGK